jgi:monofunctional glycosyltransferase
MLFSPLYMYFSHDVSKLNTQYPHLTILENKDVEVEIKEGKPKHWVKLKDISKYAKWAIVLSEDWSFYQHDGLDVEQMKVALNEMMAAERFRGASTITQQMVKNVLLSDSRTLWRKIHEIVLAQKVEKVLSKERILEIYFNSIEFGPGIYGIKNASLHYFHKSPSQVSPREGAFLAMLLPSPKRYYISFKKKKLTRFANVRIKAILRKMRMGKVLSPEQCESEISSKMSWEK